MYALFRARQLLGSVPALIALVLIALGIQSQTLKVQPVYDESAVEIALVEPEPEAVPEPVVEQETPPPVIEDQDAEPAPPPPPPKPQPKPLPKPEPKPKPAPVAAKATPTPTPPATAKPVQPAVAPTPTPAPPAPPKVDGQALEGGYLKGLRNELDTYKQYPTGRQASLERPSGEVVVWLLVDRQGRVLDSGIQTQASSMLLNRAATNSLRRIKQVKPFPEQAFGGRNEQRFTATFNYSVQ
ncbi:energy transducer TonB family protein [Pseudomonas chlororaphis]|uniref:energy transducer TonB family protein n=1 Tax=Pseudomonas chlororaphis TaxID=587753 RepID=UPI0006A653B7|nr:energy transducer TonB [Pseudomonas chlororaphis]AZD02483.1 Ferric siderophore transport system, periplasmic binding protein TonB [Pseudomonas chlororaphis subsp. chlororaphis]MBM0280531.1 energy transducer TonB [Pseudomonas chlororaphis]MDO1504829.1 energy transducer TonB [Pseudomonas chlororaphis]TWR95957.1 energy transducer TonB [Pseudomonas chlororaphis subsp. chlororaphis]WDH00792.1 energy transducer TonB [Pseudomonas chlororaphis]